MYLILDVETTGLMDFKKPADAEGQPRIATMGLIAIETAGEDWAIVGQEHFVHKPDDWEMSAEATEKTGITTEWLEEHGHPIGPALDLYSEHIAGGRVVIAHNAKFDTKMCRAELRRAGMDDLFEQTENICTMMALTPICKLPYPSGRKGNKWPKLEEALSYFNLPYEKGHDALADCYSVLAIIRAMKKQGIPLPEPKVHYARMGWPTWKRS